MKSNIVSKSKYSDLFDQLNLPGLILEAQSLAVVEHNIIAGEFFGNEEVKSLVLSSLVSEDQQKPFQQILRKVRRSLYSQSFDVEPVIKSKKRYLQLHICSMEVEGEMFIQVIIQDQTELVEAKKEVEALSITDAMTGMFNFRYFKQNLEKDFERSRRHNEDLSIILMDVDNFKHYNDNNGHPAGDKLLKELGDILKKSVRTTDVACRYGGEEFVIICPHTNAESAKILAERVRKNIESHPFDFAQNQPLGMVSVSIGISSVKEHALQSTEEMKESADSALYEAKRNGRNQVKIFLPLKKAV